MEDPIKEVEQTNSLKERFGEETLEESTRRWKAGERMEWCEDRGLNTWDIMTDEDGQDYVRECTENGTAGEDGYAVECRRVYLPSELQY